MPDHTADRALSISGPVLVWGTICTLLVALIAAGTLLVVATSAIHAERDALIRAMDAEQRLGACTIEAAKLDGRVQSFEAILVNPQRTAIEASLEEYNQIGGSDATLAQYQTWLSKQR